METERFFDGDRSKADQTCRLRRRGAKVGAGTLVHLLEGFRTHTDPRLIVGYDKSDDASVYVLDENTALVQTTDFFPPIVDDPVPVRTDCGCQRAQRRVRHGW